jgi:hypothetical protein
MAARLNMAIFLNFRMEVFEIWRPRGIFKFQYGRKFKFRDGSIF